MELPELTAELFRDGRSGNFDVFGMGEFRARTDDVSDLAGDGLARTGISNLAGLVAVDGIVAGLSRGEDDAFVDVELGFTFTLVCGIGDEDIGDGVIFNPDGWLN